MTEEQKKIADDIVSHFKNVNGTMVHANTLHENFQNGSGTRDVTYVIRSLEEKNIIKATDGHNRQVFYLLPDGWNYTSYENLLESERLAKDLKAKKDNIDLANAERVYKSYPLTRALAWIGAISGFIAIVLQVLRLLKILPSEK
jgi:hypothetical protein